MASTVTKVILGMIFALNSLSFCSVSTPSLFFLPLCSEFTIELIKKSFLYNSRIL